MQCGYEQERNVWAAGWSQVHGPAMQERQCCVLTNQCLGIETNAEPPGQGTEEYFLMDNNILIVERHWGHMFSLRSCLHYGDDRNLKALEKWPQVGGRDDGKST